MPDKQLHFEKAPIAEALIAIEVGMLDEQYLSQLRTASQSLEDDYPDSEPLNQIQLELGVTFHAAGISHQASQQGGQLGYKFVSKDKRQLAVFRRNGFSFSRLPPYERWESFRSEARRLWDIFRRVAHSAPILSFGLRYINRISFPARQDATQYLRLYPEIPDNRDGSPRILISSYLRADSTIKEPPGQLIIQQANLPPEHPGLVTLALDFDLRFPFVGSSDEYVWSSLESARDIKNELFVDSLTPTFLETFR
jgi:uncharacterized protein (TIGR04255 family)